MFLTSRGENYLFNNLLAELFSPMKKVYQYIAEYYFYCNQPAMYSIMQGIKWFIRNSAAVFSGYRINVLRVPNAFQ